jgi:hypothetical protein
LPLSLQTVRVPALIGLLLLAGCQRAVEAPAPEIRPVRAVTVAALAADNVVALTGTVQAQNETCRSASMVAWSNAPSTSATTCGPAS